MREERWEEREESANVRVLNNSNSTDRVCTTGRGHDRMEESREKREARAERRGKREESRDKREDIESSE